VARARELLSFPKATLGPGKDSASVEAVVMPNIVGRACGLVTLCLICVCALRATDQSKAYFKAGEQALAAGNTFEAYDDFQAAVYLQPSNRKYIAKKQEAAKLASARADDLGQTQLAKDIKEAKTWFEAALKYDPGNATASQHLAELNRTISEARDKAVNAIRKLKTGEVVAAEQDLSGLTRFREVVPEMEAADKELHADRLIDQAHSEWAAGNQVAALKTGSQAELQSSPDNVYVATQAKTIRAEISDSILKDAPTSPASLKDTVRVLQLSENALLVDSTNAKAMKLKMEQAPRLASLLMDFTQTGLVGVSPESARIHVELLRRYEKWINSDERYTPTAERLVKASYPAVNVRLVVNDSENCTSASKQSIADAIHQSLGRVAQLSESGSDMVIRIKKIVCSSSDVPMNNVQPVNSTYVAAYTQLANPAYLQLEEQLGSAQQELNRAEYNYSVNQNFFTGWALGAARRKVNQLQSALAATTPYSNQEVVQQYQYQRFDAVRQFQVEAVVEGDYEHGKSLGEQTIQSLIEDRKSGIAGVLPQDKSGAHNFQPSLMSMDECAEAAWRDFRQKAASAVRDQVAVVLAKRAMAVTQNSRDQLASTIYCPSSEPMRPAWPMGQAGLIGSDDGHWML